MGVAGLDQHDSRNDRETRVLIDSPVGDPLAQLRAGQFQNLGRTMRFGPSVPWSGWRLTVLTVVRAAFDVIERAQDRIARRLQSGADHS